MDWKEYFKLMVFKVSPEGNRPYFQSQISIKEEIPMGELLMEKFERKFRLTPSESKRFSLEHRKILHCQRYFKSKEFERIFINFTERLSHEKCQELVFETHGGGVYLFMALMRYQGREFDGKTITCITNEIPLPILKLPLKSTVNIRFIYRPYGINYFSIFPSLWSRPEIIRLFDKKDWKSHVA